MKNLSLTQNQKGILFFAIVLITVIAIHIVTPTLHK